RRLRLRSKPAYNIETGLLSIAPSRQAGACHWGGPSSWHSLPSTSSAFSAPLLPHICHTRRLVWPPPPLIGASSVNGQRPVKEGGRRAAGLRIRLRTRW